MVRESWSADDLLDTPKQLILSFGGIDNTLPLGYK